MATNGIRWQGKTVQGSYVTPTALPKYGELGKRVPKFRPATLTNIVYHVVNIDRQCHKTYTTLYRAL
ncbi:MAG: hypothetical protein IPP29_13045 [Bacteroidetes bacterium]|nr:hypothetical protein [Bacteroidota bacterium]